MTQSMTAFASVQKQLDTGIFSWEIKSVNHRYLDVSFRLPEAFRFLEANLRTLLRGKLSRGKLECQLKFQESSNGEQALLLNENLINGLLKIGSQLATNKLLANDLTLTSILTWPGVIQSSILDVELVAKEVEQLFQEALQQLIAARETEGKALKNHICSRLDKLSAEIQEVKKHLPIYNAQSREKLSNRLCSLQLEIDNSRLEQEVALLLTRLDVGEELDRLQTHVLEVAKILETDGAVGRRLDFLMQELNREANTLSSKSDSIALTQSAVEMKVLIEQMREQIQNIE